MNYFGDERNIVVLRAAPSRNWLVFRDPRCVMCTHAAGDVVEKLRLLEVIVHDQGLHAAGFLAYEAAPGFDPAFRVHADEAAPEGFPLLWFGLYDRVEILDQLDFPLVASIPDWTARVSERHYRRSLNAIRKHLHLGDFYQVNYSFRLHACLEVDPWDFFQAVSGAEPAPHAAYVGLEDWAVCCFSPELFFSLDNGSILSRPMKGTRPRGMTPAEDRSLAEELRCSDKDRAENVMITDMVRNDLGRIARPGSVRLTELFTVEKHATVWQMTSCVGAETDRSLAEIMTALFPPASITGAPKAAAMGIIADLETAPRRIYTGCIGRFGPEGRAEFNVAIRTMLVDKRHGLAEYGVGGGIVWDSDAQGESEECRTKARVLSRLVPEFDLLETMLWTPGEGYVLLHRHLDRLWASAEYFDFPLDVEAVRAGLQSLAETMAGPRMVRLLLDRDGRVRLEDQPPPSAPVKPLRVALAATPVNSNDPFLYHKTTHRAAYEQALAGRPGCDDVLLYNERGEVTESTRANVLVKLDGVLYTPPITCGLLAGTMRAQLLERGEIVERVLIPANVERAEQVYLVNSVRGRCVVLVASVPE